MQEGTGEADRAEEWKETQGGTEDMGAKDEAEGQGWERGPRERLQIHGE